MPTATHQLLDLKLGRPLAEYVAERRASRQSWRKISLALRDEAGVDVTQETLRGWFPDAVAEAS